MSGAVERFLEAARARGLEPEVRRFPEGTRTAVDAARAVGCDVAQIVKSMVFVADGRPFVAFTSGANRADTERLRAILGAAEVRRATAEEVREATGFAIGGTPPVGHREVLRVLMDEDLLRFDVVWAAAGTPDSVFPVAPDALRDAARAEVAAFREA
ncbi:MAG: YbaK/EbsC family protein [Actinobacteria bacterium]|nr:YbaK/EbsC family protein [Actinomycetota bacterium]